MVPQYQQEIYWMNSLQDLNGYSAQTITYTDDRPEQIVYATTTTASPVVTVNEGGNLSLPVGRDITSITGINGNIVYAVNIAGLAGTTLTWANVPVGVVSSLASNVYILSNITTITQWETVKNPTVYLPRDYDGTWFVRGNIDMYVSGNLLAGNSAGWITTVTVNNLTEISDPIVPQVYTIGANNVISSPPQVTNLENTSTSEQYTVTITSNTVAAFGNLRSTGALGGTSTWYPGNLTLRLSGNRGQVNSHLGNVTYWSTTTKLAPWYMDYTVTVPVTLKVSTVSQRFARNTASAFSDPVYAYYYPNIFNYVTTAPVLSDVTPGGTGDEFYTVTIQPTPLTAVANLATMANAGGTSVYNTTSKNLTLTGNVNQINTFTSNIRLLPTTGSTAEFTMTYQVYTLDGDILTRNQSFYANTTAGNITSNTGNIPAPYTANISSNILLPRNYTSNSVNYLFEGNCPVWTGNVSGTNTYTFTVSSPVGFFTNGVFPTKTVGTTSRFYQAGDVYTFSELRSNVAPFLNYYLGAAGAPAPKGDGAYAAYLRFWHTKNNSENSYVDFKYYKHSILQVSQQIPLLGTPLGNVIAGAGSTVVDYNTSQAGIDTLGGRYLRNLASEQFDEPGISNVLYLKANIALIGSGGAGGGGSSVPGGGGASGEVVSLRGVTVNTLSSNLAADFSADQIGAVGQATGANANGTSGGATVFHYNGATYVATGGAGGRANINNGFGANTVNYFGALIQGGGGAGAGGNATLSNGGPGIFSNIANVAILGNASINNYLGAGGPGPGGSGNVFYGGYGIGGFGWGAAGAANAGVGGIWITWYQE
jgi:hypothetical protein